MIITKTACMISASGSSTITNMFIRPDKHMYLLRIYVAIYNIPNLQIYS